MKGFQIAKATPDEAEAAGADCARNGANIENCHFRFFATRELTKAWERGKNSCPENDPTQNCPARVTK